jgi:hypothetical protein
MHPKNLTFAAAVFRVTCSAVVYHRTILPQASTQAPNSVAVIISILALFFSTVSNIAILRIAEDGDNVRLYYSSCTGLTNRLPGNVANTAGSLTETRM